MKYLKGYVYLSLCAIFLLCGCAGTTPRRSTSSFELAKYYYYSESYYLCLDEVEKQLKNNASKLDRAVLLTLKGMSQEDLGLAEAALTTYKQVITEFPNTSAADDARSRVDGRMGDQRERFTLDASALGWKRFSKNSNLQVVEQHFLPVGENFKNLTVQLSLMSGVRPENILTLDDVLARFKAQAQLSADDNQLEFLERNEDEAYLKIHQSFKNSGQKIVCLYRVCLTRERFHLAEIKSPKPDFTPGDQEKYLSQLRQLKLVGR